MEENNNKSFELKDLDEILSISKSAKYRLRDCDDEVPKMEEFINQYLETQAIDLEAAERMLFKIRAIKEQFSTNIGSASISFALYAVIISSIVANTLSDALSTVALAITPSFAFPVSNAGIKIAIFVAVMICFILLLLEFQRRTKDEILIFKCTYMEQYLANYIKKLKEQPEKTQTEDTKNTINADQSSQRKETKK